ncbi:MAG: B12-binding domain-containing protein [Pseudomonadota bacterium]
MPKTLAEQGQVIPIRTALQALDPALSLEELRGPVIGAALSGTTDAVSTLMRALRAAGHSREEICTQLLTPAADHLGDLWAADAASFTEVTLATNVLHNALRVASIPQPAPRQRAFHGPQAAAIADFGVLLMPTPGEQHTLGLEIVAEELRDAGLPVTLVQPAPTQDIRALLAAFLQGQRRSMLGVGLGAERNWPVCHALVRQARGLCADPADLHVTVGGWAFKQNAALVDRVGADSFAADAANAVTIALQFAVAKPRVRAQAEGDHVRRA